MKHSELFAAVYGRPGAFFLVPFVRGQAVPVQYPFSKQNVPLCGVMSFIDGKCAAKCEPGDLALKTMMAAVQDFARYVGERIPRADLREAFRPELSC